MHLREGSFRQLHELTQVPSPARDIAVQASTGITHKVRDRFPYAGLKTCCGQRLHGTTQFLPTIERLRTLQPEGPHSVSTGSMLITWSQSHASSAKGHVRATTSNLTGWSNSSGRASER
jgi:hypothetical protein